MQKPYIKIFVSQISTRKEVNRHTDLGISGHYIYSTNLEEEWQNLEKSTFTLSDYACIRPVEGHDIIAFNGKTKWYSVLTGIYKESFKEFEGEIVYQGELFLVIKLP